LDRKKGKKERILFYMKANTFKAKSDIILFFIAIFLILLSLSYFTKGFYNLIFDNNNGARDLLERWKEQHYIYHGFYPYDIREDSPNINPEIGPIDSGGYPPWAFFTGFLFIPRISWQTTRLYFALLNLISVFILAVFSYQVGSPYGKIKALFSMSSTLAISSHTTTLNNGQYGIIINALLIGTFWVLEKRKHTWAGLLLGLAMIKPNISALYFFILIVRKRFRATLVFSLYICFATLSIWLVTKVDPISMIIRVIEQSKYFADRGASGINFLTIFGINAQSATIILGLAGVTILVTIFSFWKNSSLFTLFAIASVIARICVYHRFYDNIMLIFLLLALIRIAFIKANKINILMSILVAASLWLPRSVIVMIDVGGKIESIQIIIWIIALIHLLFQEKSHRGSEIVS
jgi:hypothetical protein